jgi:hypothetical protein
LISLIYQKEEKKNTISNDRDFLHLSLRMVVHTGAFRWKAGLRMRTDITPFISIINKQQAESN